MSNEFIVRIDFDRSIISRFERDDRPTSHAQQLADRHSRAANDDADLDFDFLDHFHLAVPLAFVGTLASGPWHQGFGLVADALDRVDFLGAIVSASAFAGVALRRLGFRLAAGLTVSLAFVPSTAFRACFKATPLNTVPLT